MQSVRGRKEERGGGRLTMMHTNVVMIHVEYNIACRLSE